MWVPMEHRKHWEEFCHEYHACGHPVYFVNHVWYRNNVMEHARRQEEHREGEARGHHDRDGEQGRYRHGHDEDESEHGHGHGHGRD